MPVPWVKKSKPWKMISTEKEDGIRLLLSEGASMNHIRRTLKVGRDTIEKIRESDAPLNRSRRTLPTKRKFTPYSERNTGALHNLKEAKRCPDCGGKVLFWPCLACNPQEGCY